MSPRGSDGSISSNSSNGSSKTPSHNFNIRRPTGQPKSTRQQFSACGACRMRRVRCDLKDCPISSAGPSPSCSNCRERGLKCVDEFQEVKAVKLLRRGRRLAQVEAIYGKISDQDNAASFARQTSLIPKLHLEFFSSQFWRWFCIQRPVLDLAEYPSRYRAHENGTQMMTAEGEILGRMLSVWAVSFCVDERGNAMDLHDSSPTDTFEEENEKQKRDFKDRVLVMIKEIFELLDIHGVLRRPTWDGLRTLLLLLPFLDEMHSLEKLSVTETTLSQARALCTISPSMSSPPHSDDAIARARLFWFACLQEGITSALRGGRLVLSDDDLQAFNATVPSIGEPVQTSNSHSHHSSSVQSLVRLFSAPMHLNAVCRRIHAVLTGPAATRRIEEGGLIDGEGMREIWDDLDRCWEELSVLRGHPTDPQDTLDIERYIGSWQIFIFECHNVLLKVLKDARCRLSQTSSPPVQNSRSSSQTSSPKSPQTWTLMTPDQLHSLASRKCRALLPAILDIINLHLSPFQDNAEGTGLFKWDIGLVQDGCFYAGLLSVELDDLDDSSKTSPGEISLKQEDYDVRIGSRFSSQEGVAICLAAFRDMKWALSKSEDRQKAIRLVWETQNSKRHMTGHNDTPNSARIIEMAYYTQHSYLPRPIQPPQVPAVSPKVVVHPTVDRPPLPPLIVSGTSSPPRINSAPATALSTNSDSSGWPNYTPPGTGSSASQSAGTSAHASPIFQNIHAYKPNLVDGTGYYQVNSDPGQFNFNHPVSSMPSPIITDPLVTAMGPYHTHNRQSPIHGHGNQSAGHTSQYFDPNVFSGGHSILDSHAGASYVDDSSQLYH